VARSGPESLEPPHEDQYIENQLFGPAMKAVILAGGRGTRIEEETAVKPKPMVEIGGRPILWHIMKTAAT
jgi:hypothetical protein